MERRNFVKKSLLGTTALIGSGSQVLAASKNEQADLITNKYNFNLKYAPHFGMFENMAGKDLIDQLQFMADQGFTAFEDNEMSKRDVVMQTKIGNTLEKLGLQMGVFVAHKIYWHIANLASGEQSYADEFLKDIKNSVEVAKRINAKWMTVVPGHLDLKLDKGYQTANVVDLLRRACEIIEPHGLVMVLEPLNFRDHPGLFLTKSAQAFQICKAVNSPSCKILFDIYHQQITEGNLIPNIEKCWSEIAYFQIGDNPGRKEPTTGEINYQNVFKFIHQKRFDGILGMEHGNSQEGRPGEQAVIDAYKKVDQWS